MATVIDLIRHGTPEGGNRYRGHSIDDPLSEKGWQQMWSAVASYSGWDVVISSPLHRCAAFAKAYADKNQLKKHVDDRLKEIGFGDWEGYSSKQILAENPDAIRNFYHDPIAHRPQGAEPLADFQQRVRDAIDDILHNHRDRNVLVVAHAGVMRAVITAILHVDAAAMYRLSVGNAAVIRIRDDGIRPPTLILD